MATSADKLAQARRLVGTGALVHAETICREQLMDHPEDIDALQLLGGIQCRRSLFRDAAETFKKAATLRPVDVVSFRNLGFALSSAGDRSAAMEAYTRALELSPNDAHVLNDFGVVLRQVGKLEEATDCFEKALAVDAELIFPRLSLGEVQFARGMHDEAIATLEEVIRQAPGEAAAHNAMGNIFTTTGRLEDAIRAYERAIESNPRFAMAENNLATVLRSAGRLDEAVEHCQRAIELQGNAPGAHATLGSVLKLQGKVDEALEQNRHALRLQPHHVDARNNLGSILTDLGRFDEAIEHLEEALRTDPKSIRAYHNLGDLALNDQYQFSDEQLGHLKTILAGGNVSPEDSTLLHTILGGIYAKQDEHDKAFHSYQRSNDTKQRILEKTGVAFDGQEHREKAAATVSTFGLSLFKQVAGWGLDTEVPVFVVGMPRSGTTLVEQIIASHPEAAGVGELGDVRQIATELPASLTTEAAYPECMAQLNSETLRNCAQRYLDTLAKRAPNARRAVDKMWANYAYLGLIHAMFPKARIIHCRREPMDVCLSCYFCNFNSIRWACQLDDIGLYYREYERTMSHWRTVLPVQIHDVSYEQMVADPEGMSRDLIAFCELDWSDRCLEFYKHKQAVQTASRVQVRRPIYSTSVGRWKKYEPHLATLQQAIGNSADMPPAASVMPPN